jgi:hypothetical protein
MRPQKPPNFALGKKKFIADAEFGALFPPAATSQDNNHYDDRYHNNNQYLLRTEQHGRYHIVHYHISHQVLTRRGNYTQFRLRGQNLCENFNS